MLNEINIVFLEEVIDFLNELTENERDKIIYNIEKSRISRNPNLFKKLTVNIWEFRTLHQGKCFRIFAFWDKSNQSNTLIIATHGITKKTNKTPSKDIEKAENIRRKYFESREFKTE